MTKQLIIKIAKGGDPTKDQLDFMSLNLFQKVVDTFPGFYMADDTLFFLAFVPDDGVKEELPSDMEIQTFGKFTFCPKCTQVFANTGPNDIYDRASDTLKCSCTSCGYQWISRPADYKETPSGSDQAAEAVKSA